MTRPDLLASLYNASAALQAAHVAALREGRYDLAEAIEADAARVMWIIGKAVTGREAVRQ